LELYFYKRLSAFFAAHYPEIKCAPDLEKNLLIKELVNSGNFSKTHAVIASLNRHTDLTESQLNEIIAAVLANTQIHWIIGNEDVNTFIINLISGKADKIDPNNLAAVQVMLAGEKESATEGWM